MRVVPVLPGDERTVDQLRVFGPRGVGGHVVLQLNDQGGVGATAVGQVTDVGRQALLRGPAHRGSASRRDSASYAPAPAAVGARVDVAVAVAFRPSLGRRG